MKLALADKCFEYPTFSYVCYYKLDKWILITRALNYFRINYGDQRGFLSPARRGRGILVAPGFCPASSARRHVFLWAQKLLVKSFLNFNMTFLGTWGCASDFLEMLPKIQNGRQRSTLKFFVGAKTLKLSQKLFKFYYHISHDMEMCR